MTTVSKTKLMTPREVARFYRVKPTTVVRWCREGQLDCFKLGRVWRIRATDDGWPIHRRSDGGV